MIDKTVSEFNDWYKKAEDGQIFIIQSSIPPNYRGVNVNLVIKGDKNNVLDGFIKYIKEWNGN